MNKIKARSVEDGLNKEEIVELTEDQKNVAVDNDLVHYDGKEWRFSASDLKLLQSLKKSIVS